MAKHVGELLSSSWGVFALLLVAFSSFARGQDSAPEPSPCPSNWEHNDGYCYNVQYRYNSNWDTFRRGCIQSSDAEIASVRSPAEQTFVMSYLTRALQTSYQGVYIGLIAVSGHPKWEDRRPLNYTNWGQGQPAYTNGPDCTLINYNNNVNRGQWMTVYCTTRYHYGLCKKSAACQPEWFYSAKRCYRYVSAGRNWPTASNTCKQTYKSQLVSVGSSVEQSVLDYWLWTKSSYGRNVWLWLGLNDRNVEENLEWTDGTALSYTNWLSDQPLQAENFDCAQMFKHGGAFGTGGHGQWKLQDCNSFNLPYVCEKEADPTRVPPEDRGQFEIINTPKKPESISYLKCLSESMEYALKKTIAPPTKYEIPYLNNDTCLPGDNGTHYLFKMDYDECGTEIIHFHGELYFSNVISARALYTLPGAPSNGDDASTLPPLVNIQLQCQFNKEVGVTTYDSNYGFVVEVSQSPVFNVTGLGVFSPTMNLFTSQNYLEAVRKEQTKVFRLNERAYFELRVVSDNRLSVRARECWVNIGRHNAFPKALVLRDGCAINGNAASVQIHSQPGTNTQHLSYRVFGLTGFEDRIQYFHCTVRICNANDPRAFCNQGCGASRRRRQAPPKIIQVPDGNANFTFSTPGFFVSGLTKNTDGGKNGSALLTNSILSVLLSCLLAFVFGREQN